MPLSTWSSSAEALPATPGTYVLLAVLPRCRRIVTGALGEKRYPAGAWAYVGSAFGPVGLRARVRRHIAGSTHRHWHLDYLRPALRVAAVLTAPGRHEHDWAGRLAALPASSLPVARFGASDCLCRGHLVYLGAWLDSDGLSGILAYRPRSRDSAGP